MKQPNLNDLTIDYKGTRQMRIKASKTKKIKITINIDQDNLDILRAMANKTGAPYQKLLNQMLREGLKGQKATESRIDKVEKDLELIKKKLAA